MANCTVEELDEEHVYLKSRVVERFIESLLFEGFLKLDLQGQKSELTIKQLENVFVRDFSSQIHEFLVKQPIQRRFRANSGAFKEEIKKEMKKGTKLDQFVVEREQEVRKLSKKESLNRLIEQKLDAKRREREENPSMQQMLESKYGVSNRNEVLENHLKGIRLVPEQKILFRKSDHLKKDETDSASQSKSKGVTDISFEVGNLDVRKGKTILVNS